MAFQRWHAKVLRVDARTSGVHEAHRPVASDPVGLANAVDADGPRLGDWIVLSCSALGEVVRRVHTNWKR
jgi:hypothetical protein